MLICSRGDSFSKKNKIGFKYSIADRAEGRQGFETDGVGLEILMTVNTDKPV